MFALVLPSHPLLSPETLSPTHFAFRFSPATPPNHLALFVLPSATFPPGTAATVWIQLPPSRDFTPLGALGPAKPSAIYRLHNAAGPAPVDGEGDVMLDDDGGAGGGGAEIVVGVQVEAEAEVAAQVARWRAGAVSKAGREGVSAVTTAAAAGTGAVGTKVLARRIIQNAFDFLSSFGGDTVPLKAFQEWWKKFEGRIERDPGFLEREQ